MYGYRRASVEQLAIDLVLDVPVDAKLLGVDSKVDGDGWVDNHFSLSGRKLYQLWGMMGCCIMASTIEKRHDPTPAPRQWLQCQLPAVGSPEPLVARSPEVRQLHDGETCSFMYVVHCLEPWHWGESLGSSLKQRHCSSEMQQEASHLGVVYHMMCSSLILKRDLEFLHCIADLHSCGCGCACGRRIWPKPQTTRHTVCNPGRVPVLIGSQFHPISQSVCFCLCSSAGTHASKDTFVLSPSPSPTNSAIIVAFSWCP